MKRFLLIFILLAIVIAGIWMYRSYQIAQRDKDYIVLYGNVDVRQVDLGFRVSGRVISMPFEEGDFVHAGDLMTTLDPQPYQDQLLAAEAAAATARINYHNSELLLTRRQQLIGDGGVSQEDLENAQTSRDALSSTLKQAEANFGVALTNLNDTHCFAPADGTILTRIREPGTVVRQADPVYTLSLISPVWVRAYVSEPNLGLIYPGMPAEVYTDTPDGKVYHGHIGFISPVAEFTPKTVETTQLRTDLVYRLRVIADNPDRGLRQGMPVTVRLLLHARDAS